MVSLKSVKKHNMLLIFTASLMASSSVYAAPADADMVAERIKELYAEKGIKINFDEVTTSGINITLKNTTIEFESLANDIFHAGNIELNTVDAPSDGTITIGEVIIPDLQIDEVEDKTSISINGMRLEKVILPPKDAKSILDTMVFYEKSTLGEMSITVDGVLRTSVKDAVTTMDTSDRQQKIGFDVDIGNIFLSMEGDDKLDNPLAPLGIKELNIHVQSNGIWEPTKGNILLENMKFDVQDLGQLNLTANISGYDLAFVEALQKTQQNISQADLNIEASAMTMFTLFEQLNISNMEIRFDDNSITDKLIAHYAKQQGNDPAGLKQQLKLMVPLIATQLKNPEFADQVKKAAEKFFDDPKSLTLTAKPEQPVSLAAITATAALDPTMILKLLNVSISANN